MKILTENEELKLLCNCSAALNKIIFNLFFLKTLLLNNLYQGKLKSLKFVLLHNELKEFFLYITINSAMSTFN